MGPLKGTEHSFLTIHGSSNEVESVECRCVLIPLCRLLQKAQNGLDVLFLRICGCELGQGGTLIQAHLVQLSKGGDNHRHKEQ